MRTSQTVARGLGVAAALVVLAPSIPARATVVKAMSLVEKVEAAPIVVHGTVLAVETKWVVPGARVETRVTLKVIEALKGDFAPKEHLTFRRGGGRIDGFEQTAPGLSQYELGEEVILFLEPLGASYVAIGIGIGKYEVEQRRDGKFVTHAPNVAAARFDEKLEKPMVLVDQTAMTPEPLPAFLKRLRSYARGFGVKKIHRPGVPAELKPRPELSPAP